MTATYPELDLCAHWSNPSDAHCNDERLFRTGDFFASAARMLRHTDTQQKDGMFDDNGIRMAPSESRSKRCEGLDYSITRLDLPVAPAHQEG